MKKITFFLILVVIVILNFNYVFAKEATFDDNSKLKEEILLQKYKLININNNDIPKNIIPRQYNDYTSIEQDIQNIKLMSYNDSSIKYLINNELNQNHYINSFNISLNNTYNSYQVKTHHLGGGIYLNIGINYTYSYRYEYGIPLSYFISCDNINSWISGLTVSCSYNQKGSYYSFCCDRYGLNVSVYGTLDYYVLTPIGNVLYYTTNINLTKTFYP